MTTPQQTQQDPNAQNNNQGSPVPTKKKQPPARSLGTLAKRQEYEELLEGLKELEKPENYREKEKFYHRPEGDFPSEMDKLLIVLISHMKPKPEEDDATQVSTQSQQQTQGLGQGSGVNSSPMNIGGINIGSPIAPAIGALQNLFNPTQKQDKTWNEVMLHELKRTKDDVPAVALDCIDYLLSKGVNPNICTQAGMNAVLMSATLNNEEPLLRLLNNPYEERNAQWELINMKGNVNTYDVLGNDLLAYAVQTGAFYMADYLIDEMNFDINKKYFRMNNQTLLHVVSERFLYKVEASALQGMLYHFEKNSNEDKIIYLLEKGADASLVDMSGKVPEEYIPYKNEDLEAELGDISSAEEAAWDRCYNKLGEARKEIEAKKKSQRKLSF